MMVTVFVRPFRLFADGGGMLEHPADSHAWSHFGINRPPREGGWIAAGTGRHEWTCYVEQAKYGHLSRKGTWLFASQINPPELRWGRVEQRIHPVALAKHGYEKARRIGVMAMIGGKDKTKIRNATPIEFRDLLLSMVRPLAQVRRSSILESDFCLSEAS